MALVKSLVHSDLCVQAVQLLCALLCTVTRVIVLLCICIHLSTLKVG